MDHPVYIWGAPGISEFVAVILGAMGTSVDILRGAALVVTTPNDGSHEDRLQGGTYQYRVCNAGTTVCSNTATVTVP